MSRRREARDRAKEGTWAFRQCPGCNYDFITGEGRRSCNWYECPYLPEDLKVFCPECNYNFATLEGNARCGTDPPTCDWAIAGYRHARNAEKFLGRSSTPT
jgi:hypothetical protein